MTIISWDLFESSYLRPQLTDIYSAQYDEETLKKTTFSTINDLVGKGLVDIGPQAEDIVIPATIQKIYLQVGENVSVGNKYSVTYNAVTVTHTVTTATIAAVVTALASAITANATLNSLFNVFNDTTRVRLEAKTAAIDYQLYAVAERLTGSLNPTIEIVVNQKSTPASLKITDLTEITANHKDAFNVITAGVKYFLISDPVVKLQTTSGLDIQKEKELVNQIKAAYNTSVLAYLRIRILEEITVEDFWKEQLQQQSASSSNGSGGVSLADKLAIIQAESAAKIAELNQEHLNNLALEAARQEAEYQLKLEELQIESSNALDFDQQQFSNKIDELKLKNDVDLQKRGLIEQKPATNGAWTSSGQATISFIADYFVPLENTVSIDKKGQTNNFFGLPTVLQAGSFVSLPIEVSMYQRINLQIASSNNVTFVLSELVDGNWQTVGSQITDNAIAKSYSLLSTSFIRLEITNGAADNQLFIIADLLGV